MPLAFISAQRGFYRGTRKGPRTCKCKRYVHVCVKLDSRWNRETGIRGAGREMEVARGVVDALWIYCFTEPRIDATSTRGLVVVLCRAAHTAWIALMERFPRAHVLRTAPNLHFEQSFPFFEREREETNFFLYFVHEKKACYIYYSGSNIFRRDCRERIV